jgi:hypothetical protein
MASQKLIFLSLVAVVVQEVVVQVAAVQAATSKLPITQ